MICIAMSFLGKKFSFKLNLYFVRYVHANTRNVTQAPKKFFLALFSNRNFFDFSIKFF